MTAAFEAARERVAGLIGGHPNEVVFTRGATEAINLVARLLPKDGRSRVVLSCLEHHSNIVPWQLAGYEVDAAPLTADGQHRSRRGERDDHRRPSRRRFRPLSNVLGSILDAKRAAAIAHSMGALLLLDGCQAVPRLPVDVAAIGCRLLRLFRRTNSTDRPASAACGAAPICSNSLPPWQGGGSMIDRVTFAKTTFLDAPMRFEAGTPHIVGALGLHAAIDWVEGLDPRRHPRA